MFLIRTKRDNILIDCATTGGDVDSYILPALAKIGLSIADIRYLILTHSHADHAGGKESILQYNPSVEIVAFERDFSKNGATVYEMKGHTLDCVGVFDEWTGTLIAGDGLQGAGVGKYRCSLESKAEYLKTINKIQRDKKIKNILFSHAYEPWYKDGAFGREQVEKCLQDCINCIKGE